jgi:hypothetical protein
MDHCLKGGFKLRHFTSVPADDESPSSGVRDILSPRDHLHRTTLKLNAHSSQSKMPGQRDRNGPKITMQELQKRQQSEDNSSNTASAEEGGGSKGTFTEEPTQAESATATASGSATAETGAHLVPAPASAVLEPGWRPTRPQQSNEQSEADSNTKPTDSEPTTDRTALATSLRIAALQTAATFYIFGKKD